MLWKYKIPFSFQNQEDVVKPFQKLGNGVFSHYVIQLILIQIIHSKQTKLAMRYTEYEIS